ncbi:MAG: DUF5615 family PIN-like protein [Chitinophagales bacterium]|nr:DUF5615 family PIN-like protein [Chitinophagales bacterium]
MKILLDENLPRRLKFQLKEYEIFTVRELQWDAFKNGVLLKMMVQENFEIFITADQNLEYQQNLRSLPITVIVLIIPTLRYDDIKPLIPKLIELIPKAEKSKIFHIE